MNTLEAIAARRSIRKFKDSPIPEAILDAVLLAATQAPSGKNKQPWRFVVVKREMIATVSLGFTDEAPAARPRKPMGEVIRVV